MLWDPGVDKTFIRYYNKDYPRGRKERESVLTLRDNRSLVVARLYDQAGRQKHRRYPLLLRLRPKGAVCDQHTGLLAEADG